MRVCHVCKVPKELEAFRAFKKKDGSIGHQYTCIACRNKEQNENFRKTPKAYLAKARSKWLSRSYASRRNEKLKRDYGITIEDYYKKLAEQNGVCALCFRPPEKGKPLVVDHDHFSKTLRGLLHSQCNVMLGMAKDDPAILELGKAYLLTHRN